MAVNFTRPATDMSTADASAYLLSISSLGADLERWCALHPEVIDPRVREAVIHLSDAGRLMHDILTDASRKRS